MKKFIISILLAVLLGSSFAFMFYQKIKSKDLEVSKLIEEKGYAIQIGVFSSLDNANKLSDMYNGIVVLDNDKYRVYVAIVMSTNALTLLKNYYNNKGLSYYVKQIDIPSDLINTIKDGETIITATTSDNYDAVLKNILKEYDKLLT